MVYVMTMAIVDIDNDHDTESLTAYITDILEDNHIAVCEIDVEDAVIVPEKRVLAHVYGIEEEEDINKVATGKEGTEWILSR